MADAKLGNSPPFIFEEPTEVQSVDVVLPIVDGPEVKVRRLIQPNDEQTALLDRLGIELPKRLAISKGTEEAVVWCQPIPASRWFPTARPAELRNLG